MYFRVQSGGMESKVCRLDFNVIVLVLWQLCFRSEVFSVVGPSRCAFERREQIVNDVVVCPLLIKENGVGEPYQSVSTS